VIVAKRRIALIDGLAVAMIQSTNQFHIAVESRMKTLLLTLALLVSAALLTTTSPKPTQACCAAPPSGKPVVNADQTVILIWDAKNQMQHFIRQASFKSEAEDFGFLVPSPQEPELAESGNDAFGDLRKLTEPEVRTLPKSEQGGGCTGGCASGAKYAAADKAVATVEVLQDKLVPGFHAKVLQTKSAKDLVDWLKDNGYAYSPEIEAWARPYVENGWKITALKVAKNLDQKQDQTVNASALRLSFHTDRPVFPYREPDPRSFSEKLGAHERLLRIYFLADARYQGEMTAEHPWTGRTAWAGALEPADRQRILEELKLPLATGPAEFWLTEFEDNWPYAVAPADVFFSRSADQTSVRRDLIIRYVSVPAAHRDGDAGMALAVAVVVPFLVWRRLMRQAD
jgi:hypothetical protein